MSDPNAQDPLFPKGETSSTMLVVHLLFYLKEVVSVEQPQAIKHMEMVGSPPIVRTKSLMMQDQIAPLDARHHQWITLETLSITLVYLLSIHQVLATLGRYPNLMEPTIYSKWKNSMEEYLMAVNPALWTTVNWGITFPSGDATLTQDQANEIQRNYQAIRIIKSSLTSEEYDKVDGFKSAKEVWDTLFINHEGTKEVREGRIHALESDLKRFVIKEDESPQDMYTCLNKIVNKIKSLGSTRWGRREVVDKMLSAYMARDVQLPTLIREKRGFNKFTPADVIGRIEEHLITVKESKLSQEMSKMHEQLEKNKGVAIKASSKEDSGTNDTLH
jgi:hypothetical protein